jgi:hypothetical protein
MFQIMPYPANYDHLLRKLQAVHAEQARLDALRMVFEQKKPGRRPVRRAACSWITNTPKPARQTIPIACQTSYLRVWALDPNEPPKTRQRRTQRDGDGELKPRKASKKKPISASQESPVFAATDAQIADISRLWQTGATAKEIGGQVGMTYQAVSRLIRSYGMTRPEKPSKRMKATDAQIADVIRQRRDGVTYEKISEMTGLSTWIVGKIARQHAQQAAQ